MIKHFLTILLFLALFACEKQEGIGGNSSIIGKINKVRYFKDHLLIYDTIPAADENVYIIYGDHTYFDDNIETHYDGTFRFNYLFEGDYTVYTYTEVFETQKDSVILFPVTITESDKEVILNEIYITDEIDGTSTISGKIVAIDYYDSEMNIKNPPYIQFNAVEEDVYIIYEDNEVYFERFRTDKEGNYLFTELVPGKYQVYVYTKVLSEEDPTEKKAVIENATITAQGQHVIIPDIKIEK